MRRPVLLLVLALSLATATVLTAGALAVQQPANDVLPDPPATPAGPPPEEAVRRFYAAANLAIRTGDPTALDAVLAPDFVAHPTPTVATAGTAWLAGAVTRLRSLAPGAQLVPGDLLATGDRVVATSAVVGGGQGPLDGVPVTATGWGPVDLFRVADDRVAEWWALGATTSEVAFLARADGIRERSVPIVLGLTRVTLQPGAQVAGLSAPGPALLAIEGGSLVVTSHDAHGKPVDQGLEAGDSLLLHDAAPVGSPRPGQGGSLRVGTAHDIRNDGETPAVVLVAAAFPPAVPDDPHDGVEPNVAQGRARALLLPLGPDGAFLPRLPRVEARALASGAMSRLPSPAAFGLGRVTLAPGAEIPAQDAVGTTLVLVEAGTALVTPQSGRGRLDGPDGSPLPAISGEVGAGGVAAKLPAGSAAAFAPGAIGPIRNGGDGPLVLLLLSLGPDPTPADRAEDQPSPVPGPRGNAR